MSFRLLRWSPVLVLVICGWFTYRAFQPARPATTQKVGFQGTAAPLSASSNTAFEPRLIEISPWVREQIPVVTELPDQALSEAGIWQVIGAQQLGNPSPFAQADGLVFALRQDHGNIPGQVTLAHRLPSGQLGFSYHSPLEKLRVTRLQLVGKGARLGDSATGESDEPASLGALGLMLQEPSPQTEIEIHEAEGDPR